MQQKISFLVTLDALYACLVESDSGNTPLHVAAINNHYDTLVRLIEIVIAQYVPVPEVEQEGRLVLFLPLYLFSPFLATHIIP